MWPVVRTDAAACHPDRSFAGNDSSSAPFLSGLSVLTYAIRFLFPSNFKDNSTKMKILIGLIEHFGDVVACEPVARYLRAKYPNAHLSWAIQKPYRELVDVNPNIDETIVLECLTDWIKLYKHNKKQQIYDLVVD